MKRFEFILLVALKNSILVKLIKLYMKFSVQRDCCWIKIEKLSSHNVYVCIRICVCVIIKLCREDC